MEGDERMKKKRNSFTLCPKWVQKDLLLYFSKNK